MNTVRRILATVYDLRFLLVVVVITLIAAILIPIRQNRITNDRLLQTAAANRTALLRIEELNRQIQSCSTPSGACAKQNAKRLAEALEEVRHITVVANACAVILTRDPNMTDEQIVLKAMDDCIRRDLNEGGAR